MIHMDAYTVAEHMQKHVRDSLESKKEKYSKEKFCQFVSDINLLLLACETIGCLHENQVTAAQVFPKDPNFKPESKLEMEELMKLCKLNILAVGNRLLGYSKKNCQGLDCSCCMISFDLNTVKRNGTHFITLTVYPLKNDHYFEATSDLCITRRFLSYSTFEVDDVLK